MAIAAPILTSKSSIFTDSERFERWSHFKDYGIPGTVHDPVNQAAIADGSCRLLDEYDGYHFLLDKALVNRVLQALAAAPPTSNPSHFTLAAKHSLSEACSRSFAKPETPNYNFTVVTASAQNWYHALCAPPTDASWKGSFDPAYQPQQIALTAGFLCTAACRSGGHELGKEALAALAATPAAPKAARDAVCDALPWGSVDLSTSKTPKELAKKVVPILSNPCGCTSSVVAISV
jgi:hypothetical protein